MKQEEINKDLEENETSKFQDDVITMVRANMKASSSQMDQYHESWESADRIYRGYRVMDKKDQDAQAKNEPKKIIIPVSYALIQTALSFIMSTFFSEDNLYRLRGRGPEDQRRKEGMEVDINYQISKSRAYRMMYLWFQDSMKYGVGIVKSYWTEDKKSFRTRKTVKKEISPEAQALAEVLGMKEEDSEVIESISRMTVFEGTRIENVSPYCFYPDPSVPLAEFQKGSFVCQEEETTKDAMQVESGLHGVSKIPKTIPQNVFDNRTHRVGSNGSLSGVFGGNGTVAMPGSSIDMVKAVLRIEMQFTANKVSLKEDFDYDLEGPYEDDEPIKMITVVGNDQKVVKFEPLGYLHGEYTFDVIEYSPDHNAFANPGITETIYNLQELMTWFLNSHVQNVKKAIRNRFIGDPEKVHVEDFVAGKEFIRVKPSGGRAIDQAIKSIDVTDVTKSHVQDMSVLSGLLQIVTGINENALGQYSTGRRSATEAKGVGNASSSRLKMHGLLAWSGGVEPLGQKIISNTNQLRTKEFYEKIIGEDINKYPYEEVIMMSPEHIVGGFDFIPYDGSLPHDKERRASYFTSLLESMMANPQEMQALTGMDIQKMLGHIFELYGVKNFDDFKLNPEQVNQRLEASVLPDAMVEQMKQQGQIEPANLAGALT